MSHNSCFKDKNVLVTGATGGIGRAICKKFFEKGANVHAVGRDKSKLKSLVESNITNEVYEFDFNDLDSLDSLNQDILEKSQGIDILVNNAGVFFTCSLEEISLEKFQKTFNVNVLAPTLMTKFHAENMKENKWGRIFNIGSSSAYNGGELTSLYCASKHALLGLSRSLSKELKHHNIRVCNLSPSSTKTQMGKIPLASYQDYDTFIDPEEVADVLLFLASFDKEMEVKEILLNRVHVQ